VVEPAAPPPKQRPPRKPPLPSPRPVIELDPDDLIRALGKITGH